MHASPIVFAVSPLKKPKGYLRTGVGPTTLIFVGLSDVGYSFIIESTWWQVEEVAAALLSNIAWFLVIQIHQIMKTGR